MVSCELSQHIVTGAEMQEQQTTAFLTWLTEGGRARLRFQTEMPGASSELWLGAVVVTRADLSRIARHWSGLTVDAAGTLVDQCIARVRASEGGEWRPAV